MPLHFLVDADLPRRTAALCRRFGHAADDVRDLGMGTATDDQIATHAKQQSLCLMTGDFGFADVRNYPPEQYAGIVVLAISPHMTAPTILGIVEELMKRNDILARVPGRLAVVEPSRVRLRPA